MAFDETINCRPPTNVSPVSTTTTMNACHGKERFRRPVFVVVACVIFVLFVIDELKPKPLTGSTWSTSSRKRSSSKRGSFEKHGAENIIYDPKGGAVNATQDKLEASVIDSSLEQSNVALKAADTDDVLHDQQGDATTKTTPSSKHLHNLPSLFSIVSGNSISKNTTIIGDVQFLLDYAIVGFGKCGTTTLLRWLLKRNTGTAKQQQSDGSAVRAPPYEPAWLENGHPAQLVKYMYRYAIEEVRDRRSGKLKSSGKYFKGFKNPTTIRHAASLEALAKFWPRTPLIVTVRHPVHWMASLYNFHFIEQHSTTMLTVEDILSPGGRNEKGDSDHFVSTAKGEFHAMLALIGKTPLIKDSSEWDLLQPWLDPAVVLPNLQRIPNPIFFMEMNQLNDETNATRTQQLTHDLETFLGFPSNILAPSPLHVRPQPKYRGKKGSDRKGGGSSKGRGSWRRNGSNYNADKLKMDICSKQWKPILEEMMKIAWAASDWFQQYFIHSNGVTVSSRDHLVELLETWKINPCDDPIQRRKLLEL